MRAALHQPSNTQMGAQSPTGLNSLDAVLLCSAMHCYDSQERSTSETAERDSTWPPRSNTHIWVCTQRHTKHHVGSAILLQVAAPPTAQTCCCKLWCAASAPHCCLMLLQCAPGRRAWCDSPSRACSHHTNTHKGTAWLLTVHGWWCRW